MSYEYILETGVIVPDTADTLAEVAQEWRDALGRQDLVTTPDTPQGVLIAQEALARQAVARNNADLANQINPDLAGGLFLDALCGLFGLRRRAASRTRVEGVVLGGRAGTIIPKGSAARTAGGDEFEIAETSIIGADGASTAAFLAAEAGTVYCPSGTLIEIVDYVLGWETVSNPHAGAPGSDEESDEELRTRRGLALGRQGISTMEAQSAALYGLEGVRSVAFRENVSGVEQVVDGITMKPHSIWACVHGGDAREIAAALLENKTVGAAYNGAVSVEVEEPFSGQKYTVLFDRPNEVPVIARVTVKASSVGALDAVGAVRSSIIDYASGRQAGERGFAVGGAVSPFELAGAVNRAFPSLFVMRTELSMDGQAWQQSTLEIAIDEVASIMPSSILVNVS